MKKIFLILLVTAMIFSSCRKGTNDPTLSIYTRDARITNTWKLKTMSKEIVKTNIYNGGDEFIVKDIITFVDTTYTITHTDGLGTETNSYGYSLIYKLNDDGTSITQEILDTQKTKNSGYWQWSNAFKNKIAVVIDGVTYQIDELSKKEIILDFENETYHAVGNTSEKVSTKIHMLFKETDEEIK